MEFQLNFHWGFCHFKLRNGSRLSRSTKTRIRIGTRHTPKPRRHRCTSVSVKTQTQNFSNPKSTKGYPQKEVPGHVGALTQSHRCKRTLVPGRARRVRINETDTRALTRPRKARTYIHILINNVIQKLEGRNTSKYKEKYAASRTRAGEKYLTDENCRGKRSAEPYTMRSPPQPEFGGR